MAVGPFHGTDQDVAVAGTAEALVSTTLWVTSATVRAKDTNTGNVFLGDETVDSSDPPLAAGQSVDIAKGYAFDLNQIFVDAAVNGEGVWFWYMEQ
jgi:hypothetical protein